MREQEHDLWRRVKIKTRSYIRLAFCFKHSSFWHKLLNGVQTEVGTEVRASLPHIWSTHQSQFSNSCLFYVSLELRSPVANWTSLASSIRDGNAGCGESLHQQSIIKRRQCLVCLIQQSSCLQLYQTLVPDLSKTLTQPIRVCPLCGCLMHAGCGLAEIVKLIVQTNSPAKYTD